MAASRMPTPLVSSDWLAGHLGEADLVVVDASWYLAAANRNPRAEYEAGHIPGAVFWDLDEISDRNSPLPHMLPPPNDLARSIGMLGIGNQDRVIVYDGSGMNLSAPRVWWTMRLAGHEPVAVLDGGLKRWRAEGRPVEARRAPWKPQHFTIRFRRQMVRTLEETRAALEAGSTQFLDARSRGRFDGSEREPRAGLRGGHIPGARSLPYAELTLPDGSMRGPEQLAEAYRVAGVDLDRPVIVSCGSGVSACSLALGLSLLGHEDVAVYDGSWSEWGREGGPPVEK